LSDKSILIIGASGMLGHTVLRYFARSPGFDAHGTVRSAAARDLLPAEVRARVDLGVDAEDDEALRVVLARHRPAAVVNCVGVVKQLHDASDPLVAVPINTLLPHRLARLCGEIGARLIHVSTDCVFSGTRGAYREADFPDADDLYGRTKLLGEVDYPHAVTLRTSIIGPELASAHGLVGWFLAQQGAVRGFRRAVFSGLPTVELARVMRDFVLPDAGMRGVYHVAAAPINKHELLSLVAKEYGRDTRITADDVLVIDRSLDSARFRDRTGYTAPAWPDLIRSMHEFG
jgi:dTDP-4-dehydrorhamnose reductase